LSARAFSVKIVVVLVVVLVLVIRCSVLGGRCSASR